MPNAYPPVRNDLTVPDLYGQELIGDGPGAFEHPRPSRPSRPSGQGGGRVRQSQRRRRKQWGGDRRSSRAMPMVPKPVSDTRVAMGRLAIIVTVSAWLAYVVSWFFDDFFHPGDESAVARTEEILYLLIVTLLTVSALAYLLARLGFFYRTRTHHRATRASLDQYYDARRPTLTPMYLLIVTSG
jgi:hypothetical protein